MELQVRDIYYISTLSFDTQPHDFSESSTRPTLTPSFAPSAASQLLYIANTAFPGASLPLAGTSGGAEAVRLNGATDGPPWYWLPAGMKAAC